MPIVRYQKRAGEKGALNLTNFGWSVDAQLQLRLACDAILADIEEDVLEFYQTSADVTSKAADKFCVSWCRKARHEL